VSEQPQTVAIRASVPTLPSASEWQTLVQMASMLVPTGFLPSTIKTPEQAVAVMLKARELGIPPLYGLSNIVVVQGKPTCSAELMLALVYRDHGDNALIVEESTPEACRVTYRRRAWPAAKSFAFTLEDGRRAKLVGKDIWAQYPQAMLRARCISAVARLAFPDSIAGMYLPDELGAEVRVTDEGTVEVAAVPPSEALREGVPVPPVTPDSSPTTNGAPGPTSAPPELLAEARQLYRAAKAAGLDPMTPPGTDEATLRTWIDARRREIAEHAETQAASAANGEALAASRARAAAQPSESSESNNAQPVGEGDQYADWEALTRGTPRVGGPPPWMDTPLGTEVMVLADQLTDAGLTFALPPDGATEAELKGWTGSKRGLLRQRSAHRSSART
jgi:hypothetical protein